MSYFLLLASSVLIGYQKIRGMQQKVVEADMVIQKAQQFEVLNKSISDEISRCQEFVAQKEGEFGAFEYCKGFLQWAEGLK